MEYLSDGITEAMINTLSQLPKLRVMARSTVFRYKGRAQEPQAIGRDLSVRAVLTGRVLHRGEMLVIGAELVDVEDGSQIWGGQFNRRLSDIFELQEEISNEMTDKLRLSLTGDQKKRLAKPATREVEAYQAYLKGRYLVNKRTAESFAKAIEHFEEAIATDPSYAAAYAGLGETYALSAAHRLRPHGSARGDSPCESRVPPARSSSTRRSSRVTRWSRFSSSASTGTGPAPNSSSSGRSS